MKTFQYSPLKSAKSPTGQQSYMGYLTQKQLQQLYKFKKEQDSDKESHISGHSNKGRRMKLRHVEFEKILLNWDKFWGVVGSSEVKECRDIL